MEIWATIYDFPTHEVSTYGRVRNKKTKRVLRPFPDRYGYLRLSIGKADNVYIHRLVCKTFIGDPTLERYQVNHIDGDRQNNMLDNLEYCSARDNILWGVNHGNINPYIGLEKACKVNKRPVYIAELDKHFSCIKECAEFLGVKPTNVSRCLSGSRKGQRLHGYHISYSEGGNIYD